MSDGRVDFNINTSSMINNIKSLSEGIEKTLKGSSIEMKNISSEFSNISREMDRTTTQMVQAVNALNGSFKGTLGDFKGTLRGLNKKDTESSGKFSRIDTAGNVLAEGRGKGLDNSFSNFSLIDDKGVALGAKVKPNLKGLFSGVKQEIQEKTRGMFEGITGIFRRDKVKDEDTILGKITGLFKKGFFLAAVVKAAQKIKDTVAESLQVASDIEETQNVVNNTFKEHGKTIEDFANSSIRAMGISSLKAKQYASTYKSMMSGLSVVNEDMKTDLAMTLTGMAADIGSFFSSTMGVEEAFEMLKAPLDKQSLKVAKIGVNMTQESLEEWGKNYGIMYKDLSLQEQTLMRIAFIMDQTSVAQGDFIKNSDSWHNQLELIRNKMVEIKGVFGDLFINILKPGLEFVNNVLDVFLGKLDAIVDKVYVKLGKERPEREQAKDRGTIGSGYDITDTLLQGEDNKEKEEKESKKKELDTLGIDKIATLKTDYSDPEKEKDRKAQSNQFNKVYDLLNENMEKRDLAIKDALNERDESKGPLFKLVKGFVDDFNSIFGGNFEDIFDGLKDAFSGLRDFIGNISKSFMNTSIEIGTKDLIDKITNEFKEIGGVIGDLFTDGDEEGEGIGAVIGKILAYIVKMGLSFLYIMLKILNSVLSLLRDSGLLLILTQSMELFLSGIMEAIDIIAALVELITKPIIDPQGAAQEVIDRDEEFKKMKDSGEYTTGELIKESLSKNIKRQANLMASAFPDLLKFMTGRGDKTYLNQINELDRNLALSGDINSRNLKTNKELAGIGREGDVVNNNISVMIDGREVRAYIKEDEVRERRVKGMR